MRDSAASRRRGRSLCRRDLGRSASHRTRQRLLSRACGTTLLAIWALLPFREQLIERYDFTSVEFVHLLRERSRTVCELPQQRAAWRCRRVKRGPYRSAASRSSPRRRPAQQIRGVAVIIARQRSPLPCSKQNRRCCWYAPRMRGVACAEPRRRKPPNATGNSSSVSKNWTASRRNQVCSMSALQAARRGRRGGATGPVDASGTRKVKRTRTSSRSRAARSRTSLAWLLPRAAIVSA